MVHHLKNFLTREFFTAPTISNKTNPHSIYCLFEQQFCDAITNLVVPIDEIFQIYDE